MNMIIGTASFLGIIWLGFLFRQFMVDNFRHNLFHLRYELFWLGEQEDDFGSEEYMFLKRNINNYIRNADKLSFTFIKRAYRLCKKYHLQVEEPNLKPQYRKIYDEYQKQVVQLILWRTPFSYLLIIRNILYLLPEIFLRITDISSRAEATHSSNHILDEKEINSFGKIPV